MKNQCFKNYNFIDPVFMAGRGDITGCAAFKRAKANLINSNTMVVTSSTVENPAEVRYGWAKNPDDLNLYNSEGLPANPFRTDTRKGITK